MVSMTDTTKASTPGMLMDTNWESRRYDLHKETQMDKDASQQAYDEAVRQAYDDGFVDGYAEGRADGYDEGVESTYSDD